MKKQEQIKNDIDSIDIVNIFKKGKMIIAASVIVTVAATYFTTKVFVKPVYEASTKILVREERLNPKHDFPSYEAGRQFVNSQAVIMKSRPVIVRALGKIDFTNESLSKIDPSTFKNDTLSKSIDLMSLDTTNILELRVEQQDPLFASMLANAIAETYIDDRVKLKTKTIERIIASLEKEIKSAKKDFADAENKVNEISIKENMILLSGSNMILDLQKYANVDMQLISANADLEALNTKLNELKKLVKSTDSEKLDLNFLVNSNVLQNLKSQIRIAELKLDVLMGQYSINHPEVIVAQAANNRMKVDLTQETKRVVNAEIEFLEIEKKSFLGKRDVLLKANDKQNDRMSKLIQNQPKLAWLNRDIEMKRAIYSDLMGNLQDLKVLQQRTLLLHDAEIIEFAGVPDSPIKPNLLKNLLLSGLVGLTIGFGMALAFSISFGEEVKAEQDSPQVTERRSSPRTETYNKVMCTVVGEKREYDCWGKNIGRSGMKIITNKKLQRNNILKFEIHCNKMKPIVGNGIVVWSSPVSVGGISEYAAGVKFYDLELDINNDIA